MIIDAQNTFDPTGTLASTIGANTPSVNTLDLGVARDLGPGEEIKLAIAIATAFTAAGAATLNVQLQGSPDNATWTTIQETSAMPVANLVAGFILNLEIASAAPGQARPRYYRLNYQVATGPFTAGVFSSFFTLDRQNAIYYPPGVVVFN